MADPDDLKRYFGATFIAPVDDSPESFADVPNGLVPIGPFSFTGYFLRPDQAICVKCHQPFTIQPDGPTPYVTVDGHDVGPLCDPCAAEMLS